MYKDKIYKIVNAILIGMLCFSIILTVKFVIDNYYLNESLEAKQSRIDWAFSECLTNVEIAFDDENMSDIEVFS